VTVKNPVEADVSTGLA